MSVKVKICGLTRVEDAVAAAEAGADFLGFILYPPSRRYIDTPGVARLLKELRGRIRSRLPVTVGVFVDVPADEIAGVLDETGLDLAQLHGDEDVATLEQLQGRAFKAIRPASLDAALALADQFATQLPSGCPQLLVDAYSPGAYGGTGLHADWDVARGLVRSVPRLFLAGGLTPANVGAAVSQVAPWGLDVSSGVEVRPGQKDHTLVRDFISAARAAETRE